MPSATLGVLVELANDRKSNQRPFMLTGLQETVRKVIRVSRLDDFFQIHPSVEAALDSATV